MRCYSFYIHNIGIFVFSSFRFFFLFFQDHTEVLTPAYNGYGNEDDLYAMGLSLEPLTKEVNQEEYDRWGGAGGMLLLVVLMLSVVVVVV